ncbi:MAG: CAP domain-containing protein [Oligoflexales bacterium]|nr:CAP domain-containing protein [Oligoflexales bacterium]
MKKANFGLPLLAVIAVLSPLHGCSKKQYNMETAGNPETAKQSEEASTYDSDNGNQLTDLDPADLGIPEVPSKSDSEAEKEKSGTGAAQPKTAQTATPKNTAQPKKEIPVPCIDTNKTICGIEMAIVNFTNIFRASNSLPPYTTNYEIGYVARDWSAKCTPTSISHNGFPQARAQVYSNRFPNKAPPSLSAENIAKASFNINDTINAVAQSLVEDWKRSTEGHRENLLGSFKSIGVGVSCINTVCVATQIFSSN